MRFIDTILSLAALAATTLAVTIDTYPKSVVAGSTYNITFSPKDSTPVTITLRQGQSANLNTIAILTSTASGGSYQWTVDKSLTDFTNYALQITKGSEINYSGNDISLTGGSGSAALSSALSSIRASASSALASAASSASAAVSSARASVTASASAGLNSTISSATLSRASASSSARATGTGSSTLPQSTGAASSLSAGPMAALFGAVAAFAYLA